MVFITDRFWGSGPPAGTEDIGALKKEAFQIDRLSNTISTNRNVEFFRRGTISERNSETRINEHQAVVPFCNFRSIAL